MPLLDKMIKMRRLEEFIRQLIDMNNEEMEDKSLWEIWLHKVWNGKNYPEFRNEIKGETTAAPTQEETRSIVQDSKNILNGFVPGEGLVDRNGTVQAAGNHSG